MNIIFSHINAHISTHQNSDNYGSNKCPYEVGVMSQPAPAKKVNQDTCIL